MREAGDADDVGSMAAAGAFGVIGVDRPAADGRDGVFEEAGLVERVGMDGDLHVEAVGYIQASANRGGSRAQSSRSLRPPAAARTRSSSAPCRLTFPVPRKPRLIGKPSPAWSSRPTENAP